MQIGCKINWWSNLFEVFQWNTLETWNHPDRTNDLCHDLCHSKICRNDLVAVLLKEICWPLGLLGPLWGAFGSREKGDEKSPRAGGMGLIKYMYLGCQDFFQSAPMRISNGTAFNSFGMTTTRGILAGFSMNQNKLLFCINIIPYTIPSVCWKPLPSISRPYYGLGKLLGFLYG